MSGCEGTLPLALTMGEPAGIGGEITLKAWQHRAAGTGIPKTYTLSLYSISGDTATLVSTYATANTLGFPDGSWLEYSDLTNLLQPNTTYAFTHQQNGGGGDQISAVLGNQIDLLAATVGGPAAAQMASGKLKGLGLAADKRSSAIPNVPTYSEQGFPRFTAASWSGFFAPAKTDPKILVILNSAINDIIKTPAVQKKLVDLGFDPIVSSQPEAEALFNTEIDKWGKMVKALGLTVK